MSRFTDTIEIGVLAGKGGPGAATFHREKYIDRGGPDGGDGGRGGDVYVEADRRYYNLSHLFPGKIYRAKGGESGHRKNCHGADGEDLVIKVPVGTVVKDFDTGEILADLTEENEPVCIAHGGLGGKGNSHFKTSTNQSPRYSQPGLPGEEKTLVLDLKLIADIGLLGLPNAGKSTLLSMLTNANPKIGDYPFTTITPNIGVVEGEAGTTFTIADIPGIIEGAHRGLGLGLSFLQHIERVKILVYMIDVLEGQYTYTFELLRKELASYKESLLATPFIILLSRKDMLEEGLLDDSDITEFCGNECMLFSSYDEDDLVVLKNKLFMMLEEYDATQPPR